MKRKASVAWSGDLKSGKGTISTDSGALNALPYAYSTRFGEAKGTNPEELVAAAHASCFSMALSNELGKAGITNPGIATTATVELKIVDGAFAVTASHLDVTITAKGADQAALKTAAESAEANCPISKLLRAEISMTATYET
ncbi:MAG: OsmC family peroxiredoxin [Rhizomicrobium sp.]